MTEDLKNLIAHIKSKARTDQIWALEAATELVEKYPEHERVWSLRSYVYRLLKRYTDAVHDDNEAISIEPSEPGLYFRRGRSLISLERYKDSVSDFSRGIELCDLHNSDYYRETLHFFRAFCYLKVGDKKSALTDLEHVKDEDFSLWVDGMVSKKQLLDAAQSR